MTIPSASARKAASDACRRQTDKPVNTHTGPWCVVLEPGTNEEYVEQTQHDTHAFALAEAKRANKAGISADVAKRLRDGSLTYEF